MSVSARAYQTLSCLKLFLVIFTVVFLFTGVIFLASGIYAQLALTHYDELSPLLNLSIAPPIISAVGGFIIFSGLFGFVAAVKNNKFLINLYCFLLSFVFILEVFAGVGAIVFLSKFEDSFKQGFSAAVNAAPTNKYPTAMDRAQEELKCCGATSYNDWFYTEWANTTFQCDKSRTTVPVSCCIPVDQSSQNSSTPSTGFKDACFCGDEAQIENIYTQGCLDALFGKNGETLYYLLSTAFGCALIQLISMIIAICIYYKQRVITSTRRY